MTGSVAVGVVIVSGSTPALTFSDFEMQKVISKVYAGLDFLDTQEPKAKLAFVYDIHTLTVAAQPCPHPGTGTNHEACEAPWRDPALTQLGYPAGLDGCRQYAEALIPQKNTNWAYVAFFTKYPLAHFAYAGAVHLCMEYSNDNWKPRNLHKVFAHETCHIFGAADEYKESNCDCEPSGYLQIPNKNCEHCPGEHVDCLMDENDLSLCQWTRGQIGWNNSLYPEEMDMRNYVPTGMKEGDTGRWDAKLGLKWVAIGSKPTVKKLNKTELQLSGEYDLDFIHTGNIDIHIWGFHDVLRYCLMQLKLTGKLAQLISGTDSTNYDSGVVTAKFTEGLPGSVSDVPYVAYGEPAVVTQAPYPGNLVWYPSIVFEWTRENGAVLRLAFEDTAL